MTHIKFSHVAFLAVVGLFCLIYSFIFIIKHDFQFQTFGWDTGYFHQIIYKASQGNFSYSTIENQSFITDHFQPFLLVLTPVIRIVNDAQVLLIIQATIAVLGVIPLYFFSLAVNRSLIFAWAVSLSYLLMVSFQHAIFDGFTQTFFVAPLLGLLFLAVQKKWQRIFWLCVIGIVLVKEEFSLILVGIGAVIFFYYHRRQGILTAIIGLISFLFLIYFLDPLISPANRNWAHYQTGYGATGQHPETVLLNFLAHPITVVSYFFDQPAKITAVKIHVLSSAFLPLFAPVTLIPIMEEYAFRFLNTVQPAKWLAHDFDFSIFLGVGTVFGARFLNRKFSYHLLAAILTIATLGADLYFHGPINSLLKPQFYHQEEWSKDNHRLLSQIPSGVSVAANNSLVAHLGGRNYVYQLPDYHQAKYIAVDLHNGPNDFAPIDFAKTRDLIYNLQSSGEYRVIYTQGKTYLLQRN